MPLFEIYIVEQNRGVITVEAESADDALEEFFENGDWHNIDWIESELIDSDVTEVIDEQVH